MEKIINDKVDKLLKRMEKEFKKAANENKKLNEELDQKVKKLIEEHDSKAEVKRYVEVKDLADYIALTISMPIKEGTKERVIEEIVEECEKNGTKTKESI